MERLIYRLAACTAVAALTLLATACVSSVHLGCDRDSDGTYTCEGGGSTATQNPGERGVH